jgi:hypothetical protein
VTALAGETAFAGETWPVPDPLVVVGNCQAESLRLLLDPAGERSVRVPPVFELDAHQTVLLHRLVSRASVLVSQPVRDDYRGHAVGTAQLRALLPPSSACVVVPIVRHLGLHPFQVVHHAPEGVPALPVVPYHDLRTVRALLHPDADPHDVVLRPEMVRAVAQESLAELARRERATDVVVSDLLERPGPEHLRTVNHPGNPVLLGLAGRVAERLGLPPVADPGRPLLSSVRAPLDPVVAKTWGFEHRPEHTTWWLEGRPLDDAVVVQAHRAWYAERPEHLAVAQAVWERHLPRARVLGLAPEDDR